MPVRKKWVVDEKGFHAKTLWEPAPADKTAVYINDLPDSPDNVQSDEKNEVELLKGTWREGEEGFQFNKKCRVRVEGKFLKKTSRKKVVIDTFVEFDGEVEDLGQQVETFLDDDGIAKAEVMLFYGDKYSKALQENPDITCRYTFKAKSSAAKKVLESETLEMPQIEHIDLKEGMYDDLAVKTYTSRKAGKKGHVKGEAIKKLQEDIHKTGIEGIGKIDGDFGGKTKKALIEFQKAAGKKQRMQKDGKIVEEADVLKGHKEGVVDKITSDELNKWIEKGWKIPKIIGVFPLPKQYQDKGYHSDARAFGSSRNNGARAHAGCDLYAPLEIKIYAVADGTIKGYYNYYWKTFALVVDHGDFVVLYGEVQPAVDPKKHGATVSKDVLDYIAKLKNKEKRGLPSNLKIGSNVKKGEHIAYVGQLYTNSGSVPFKHTMLHFEKYRKTAGGALTQAYYTGSYEYVDKDKKGLKFKRRKDLENPTQFLDDCELTD